jgi:hypothetical protein
MILTHLGTCTADDYLEAFWTRQKSKNDHEDIPTSAESRLEAILGRYPYKFPCEGQRELTWSVCRVSSVEQLGSLWMHKNDDFLTVNQLLPGSQWLKDLAKKAINTKFFDKPKIGSCGINYREWKGTSLKDRLANTDRPLLVQHPYLIDIVDGFGRLLPYLALVYEGSEFHPFDAFLAIPK